MKTVCPICEKPSAPAHKPFCSERCAQVDLGRWLTGSYALPAAPQDPDGEDGGEDGAAG